MFYQAIETDSSFCGACEEPVTLLCPDDLDGPSFYICRCGRIARAGGHQGVVRKSGWDREEERDCDEKCAVHAANCNGCCDHNDDHSNACVTRVYSFSGTAAEYLVWLASPEGPGRVL